MGTKVEQGKERGVVGDKARMQVNGIGLTEKVICGKDVKEMRENHGYLGKVCSRSKSSWLI